VTARPVVPNPVGGVVTAFNAKHGTPPRRGVLLFMQPSLGPTFVNVGTVLRERGRWVLDILVPTMKILICPCNESVISRLDLTLGATRAIRGARKVPFVANPRRCVAPGYHWTFEGHYTTGAALTTTADAPCAPSR
jgi:hypothetical protein